MLSTASSIRSASRMDGIVEHGQPLRVFLRDEVYRPDAYGAHLLAPLIPLLNTRNPAAAISLGTASSRAACIGTGSREVVAPTDPDTLRGEFVDAEPVAHVLGEFQHDPEHLIVIVEVGRAGDAVPTDLTGDTKSFCMTLD